MLGCIARGAPIAAAGGSDAGGAAVGGVRWQKEVPRIRTASFDAMALDATQLVEVERFGGGYANAGASAPYDDLLQSVVGGLLTKDGIVGDTQEERDAEYARLMTLYNDARALSNSLQNAAHANAPSVTLEVIDKAIAREQELLGTLLAFETVKPPLPPTPQFDADDADLQDTTATAATTTNAATNTQAASGAARGDSRSASTAAAAAREREPDYKQHNFTHILNRVHLCYEKKQAQFFAALRMPSLVDQIVNPVESSKSYVSGRERLNVIRQILDSFGLERSDMQKQFHEDMIGACAKLIFRDDLLAELDDLLLELGVDELMQQFMAITPRRFGKTYSVAMFVVAMLFGVEGIEQAIFSTGRRASQKLIELIYRFMCKIPGMRESIIKHNVETIWIQGPYGKDDVRKVSSYPSNVRISDSSFVWCRVMWCGVVRLRAPHPTIATRV